MGWSIYIVKGEMEDGRAQELPGDRAPAPCCYRDVGVTFPGRSRKEKQTKPAGVLPVWRALFWAGRPRQDESASLHSYYEEK